MEHAVYTGSIQQVLESLETDQEQGLSVQEGERRLEQYGENRLEQPKQAGMIRQVLGQLKDPMILVLLAAAALSFFAGGGRDWLDAAIILLIVLVNTVISVSQEDNARKALEALGKLTAPRATVLRGGLERRVESARLVPGDILLLQAGDYVPADGRVLWEAGLQTDESAMTGESLPVHKKGGGGLAQDTPLAERRNMVIGGTMVTGGRGKVVVTATGMDTEMGKIAGLLLRQGQGETPLQRRMGEVSKVLSLVCLGVCAVMFGVGMLQHRDILDLFLTAVALAVAAIPEGLPAIVTIVLAMGVGRMARRHAGLRGGDRLGQDGPPHQEPDDRSGGLDCRPRPDPPGPHPGGPVQRCQGGPRGIHRRPHRGGPGPESGLGGPGEGPAGAGHAPAGGGPL